jgi:sortase A
MTTASDAPEASRALTPASDTKAPPLAASKPGGQGPKRKRKRKARRQRQPLPFAYRLLSDILGILSVGLISLVVYLVAVTAIQQGNVQNRLHTSFAQQAALATVPTGGAINPGTPVAQLSIPALHVDQIVVQGTSSGDLMVGPGHLRNTPLPGTPGDSFLYGKSTTFGAPFRNLDKLHPGDPIKVTTGVGDFTYRVIDVRRPGNLVPPPLHQGQARLTLVTSMGANLIQRGNVLFVDADQLTGTQSELPGRSNLIPPEEFAMSTDPTTANIGLVLWLQALGLAVGASVWALRRWGRSETLIVGIPIVLAVVWNIDQTIAQLLPNLL